MFSINGVMCCFFCGVRLQIHYPPTLLRRCLFRTPYKPSYKRRSNFSWLSRLSALLTWAKFPQIIPGIYSIGMPIFPFNRDCIRPYRLNFFDAGLRDVSEVDIKKRLVRLGSHIFMPAPAWCARAGCPHKLKWIYTGMPIIPGDGYLPPDSIRINSCWTDLVLHFASYGCGVGLLVITER